MRITRWPSHITTPRSTARNRYTTSVDATSFNAGRRGDDPPSDVARVLQWLAEHTVPLSTLNDAVVVRRALDALTITLDGQPAAATTVARKRSVVSGVLRYGVELELLPSNSRCTGCSGGLRSRRRQWIVASGKS
jgi:hypothetical protein